MIRPASPTAARIALEQVEGRCVASLRKEHRAAIDAADRLPRREKERLWTRVGNMGQRLDVGGVGVHPIAPSLTSGRFELAEVGPLALIIPVRPAPNDIGIPLLDLCAWLPKEGRVFTRFGAGVLGWDHVSPVNPDGPVMVHPDPGAWCRANGQGVVLVDWQRAWPELGHLPALVVDSVSFGERLKGALQPPEVPLPRIFVRSEAIAA